MVVIFAVAKKNVRKKNIKTKKTIFFLFTKHPIIITRKDRGDIHLKRALWEGIKKFTLAIPLGAIALKYSAPDGSTIDFLKRLVPILKWLPLSKRLITWLKRWNAWMPTNRSNPKPIPFQGIGFLIKNFV